MAGLADAAAAPALRALTGADELAVDPAEANAALRLLARLAEGVDVDALDVSAADRLLAAIYLGLYGDRCECQVGCRSCGDRYGFELSVSTLLAEQEGARPKAEGPGGSWWLPDGGRVRAPRVGELTLGPEALMGRIVLEGRPKPEVVLAFLERAAPVLVIDLRAPCPACGADQEVRFDLARFLEQRLADERPFLLREIHLIASRYGWPLSEILGLRRKDRRAFAGLVEAERASAARRRA